MILDSQKLKIKEIYPQLKENNSIDTYLDILPSKELKEYALACLEKTNYKPTDKDLLLLEVMCDFGLLRGQINAMIDPNPDNEAKMVYIPTNILATQIVAAIIRNIYFDIEHPITSLVRAREELYDMGKYEFTYESGRPLNDQTLQQIFQCVEAQMGPLTPIETLAPVQRSPQEDFATAVFIVDNIERWNK